jgi:hypothetical protein
VQRLSWLLLSAALCACKSDAQRAHEGQVARLAELIGRLRRADNQDKRAALQELERVPCPDPSACALQDLCLRAYGLHQEALDMIDELKGVERSAAPAPLDLPESMARAQSTLDQAKTLSEQCAEEQVRVMRKSLIDG